MHRFSGFAVVAFVTTLITPAIAHPSEYWEIGPNIRGKNYSVGMPLHPTPAGKGWQFDFPGPTVDDGHVHYVTFAPGSMAGKTKITVRYRVDAADEVRFVSREAPSLPATVSLYFQRRGDTWSGKGKYELYRWFPSLRTVRELRPGVHEMAVRLDDPDWGAVFGKKSRDYPREFRAALNDIDQVGLLFGSAAGRGHGVFATGPARFILLDFRIE